jgi:hypothetical protein
LTQTGGSSGKDTWKFVVEQIGPTVFGVRPATPLRSGEYAFFVNKQGQGGQMWDFGVDGK